MSKRKSKETGGASAPKKRNLGPAWQVGLLKALDDESIQLFADDRVVVIDDAYKKAFWLLIAPPSITTTFTGQVPYAGYRAQGHWSNLWRHQKRSWTHRAHGQSRQRYGKEVGSTILHPCYDVAVVILCFAGYFRRAADDSVPFQFGFHSVPSMR